MKKIRIIASDLDGTIIRDDNTISERTQLTLRKIMQQGIRFLPCTGRCYDDMQKSLHKDFFQSAILLNGALFVDQSRKVLMSSPMQPAHIQVIEEAFISNGLPCLYFASEHIYGSGDLSQLKQCIQQYHSENPAQDYFMVPIREVESSKEINEDILKLESVHVEKERLIKMQETMRAVDGIHVSHSLPFNIEVTAKKVNKAEMLKKVAQYYGVQLEEVLFFGDSANDLEVFTQFPNCIAVKNAIEDVRKLAHTICESCEDDGVARYIEENILKTCKE